MAEKYLIFAGMGAKEVITAKDAETAALRAAKKWPRCDVVYVYDLPEPSVWEVDKEVVATGVRPA